MLNRSAFARAGNRAAQSRGARRRQAVRAAAVIAGMSAACAGPALAGEEAPCASQYSLEQHLLLEWAALGGDPHAQYAITQCALPNTSAPQTPEARRYAVKWLTLAACDGDGSETVARRDRRLRELRDRGDISFRRFSGIERGERFSKREKMFQEYRDHKNEELGNRLQRMFATASPQEIETARQDIAADFSRMGPMGLMRLAELSSCSILDADAAFQAGAWAAAATAWAGVEKTNVYGASDRKKWSPQRESESRMKALDKKMQRTAEIEKQLLLKADPNRIDAVEERAALANLQEFSMPLGVEDSEAMVSFRAAPLAVQYALEAKGMIEFVHGPDNDYGPATIEAARRYQASKGRDANRWLSNADVRETVCEAATELNDPVSLYNVAMMYRNGWGFPQDIAKARVAIERSASMIAQQQGAAHALPDWKKAKYLEFGQRIAEARRDIAAEYEVLPTRLKRDGAPICD